MHPLLLAVLTDSLRSSPVEPVAKISVRQIIGRARKLPGILRLRSAGLRYGQRVAVTDDPDQRKVGRALDFRRVIAGGAYRDHPSLSGPRVEVSAGKGRSLFAPRKSVRPVRG